LCCYGTILSGWVGGSQCSGPDSLSAAQGFFGRPAWRDADADFAANGIINPIWTFLIGVTGTRGRHAACRCQVGLLMLPDLAINLF
jgi:hypothetical protein